MITLVTLTTLASPLPWPSAPGPTISSAPSRWRWWEAPSQAPSAHCCCSHQFWSGGLVLALLRKQFLKQRQRGGILALAQPEECRLPELGVLALAHEANEGRHPLLSRPLRQGEDRGLPHLPIAARILHDRVESRRGGLSSCLTEPEDGGLPSSPSAVADCGRSGAGTATPQRCRPLPRRTPRLHWRTRSARPAPSATPQLPCKNVQGRCRHECAIGLLRNSGDPWSFRLIGR